MEYQVSYLEVDRFFYSRVHDHPCATKEEAIALAIEISQKQPATLFATDESGKMTCTLFVRGEVHGIDNIGVGA